jgi:hypothetical protein
MRWTTIALALCSLLATGCKPVAKAQHHRARPLGAVEGVWQGTLGSQQVDACFGTAESDEEGAYFYLRHLELITLVPPPDVEDTGPSRSWIENGQDEVKPKPGDARWTLAPRKDGSLEGTWSQSGRSLPVHLTRVAWNGRDEACGSMTFMAPRIVQPTVTRIPANLDGVAYTKLKVNVGAHFKTDIETFELPATSPAAAKVNAQLAEAIPKVGGKLPPDYVVCAMTVARQSGGTGESGETLAPGFISRRWLAVEDVSNEYCGGAHPNTETMWRIWSLESGEAMDLWSWFGPGGASRNRYHSPVVGPGLRKLLIAHWPQDEDGSDCNELGETAEGWSIHPTREGLAFFTELDRGACSGEAVVPYGELAPVLSTQGKAAIASLEEDVRVMPPKQKKR